MNFVVSSCYSDHPILPSLSVSRLYVNLLNCLNTPHLIIPYHPLQDIVRELELGQFKLLKYSYSDFPILPSLSVSRACVNLISCLNIVHLITLSHSHPLLYPSPECKWTCSIVWTLHLIIPSHPLQYTVTVRELGRFKLFYDHPILPSLSVSRVYMNLLNCLNTPLLIIQPHPLQGNVRELELGQFKLFEYTFFDFPFIRPQGVRQLDQLFKYRSSDHPIIPLASSFVSSLYVNMLNCLSTPNLIISSHPLQYTVTVRELGRFKLFFWSSYPTLFICLQSVRQLAQLFEYPSFEYSISSSPGRWQCTWTWSIQVVWILLFWFSYSTLFIRLQGVRELHQLCLNTVHLITLSRWHPLLYLSPDPVCTCICSIVWVPLIWLSHSIFSRSPWVYVNLVDSSWTTWILLFWLSYPTLVIHL